ncbi:DNA-binding transcriptional LysR family regulator [Microterricola gilva]|uniref:DNA-binding transcriptional LysR family regulator n=1 Tax=Microterricola gilva TaxID=393267 RepID=A0A4Q8APG7_9MICO|nr:LysR family transcriptional regulator [Microterricola gilva]RZU66478.1 DNA-binding transcriptional LysR family regulator [Microterricola gilva]
MIDPRRLLVLRAFVLSESVTATAAAMHLTPSAVSQQLAALEREVGQALVVRTGRKLALTPAGRILSEHAEEINSRLKIAEAELAAHSGGVLGQLRIAAFPTAISWVVAPAIVELRRNAPGIDVKVIDAEAHMSHRMLMRGDVDVTVSLEYQSDPERDSPDIMKFPLYIERFKAVLPHSHPLAGSADGIELTQLTGDGWIMPSPGNPCRAMVLQACAEVGFHPPITHVSDDYRAAVALVAAEAGICLVPESALAATDAEWVSILPTRGIAPLRKVTMTTRRDNQGHPVVRAGLDAMRAVLAEPDSEIHGPLARSDTFSVE